MQESSPTEHAELTLMTDLEQTSGGAAVSAAPTKQTAFMYSVGALLALASGKAERRQVHPLGRTQKSV